MSKDYEEALERRLNEIEKDRGEYIYFERNPADPTLPHMMRDVNTAKLREVMWLEQWFGSCVPEHTEEARLLTKEEAEKIISVAVPTSKSWSETHKQVICSFIPCPCCEMISMIVEVSCQGWNLGKKDEITVSGWYRVDISAGKGGKFAVKTRRLEFKEKSLMEQVVEI